MTGLWSWLFGGCFQAPSHSQTIFGNGNIVNENRPIEGEFNAIDVAGACEVLFVSGQAHCVNVQIDSNLLPRVRTTVHRGVLVIGMEPGCHSPTQRLQLQVSAPSLSSIKGHGECRIQVQGLQEKRLHVELQGACRLQMAGRARSVEMMAAGDTRIRARELDVDVMNLSLMGSSKATVHVTDLVRIDGAGACEVDVFGSPARRTVELQGAGHARFP